LRSSILSTLDWDCWRARSAASRFSRNTSDIERSSTGLGWGSSMRSSKSLKAFLFYYLKNSASCCILEPRLNATGGSSGLFRDGNCEAGLTGYFTSSTSSFFWTTGAGYSIG
jgi:hypothetical protein